MFSPILPFPLPFSFPLDPAQVKTHRELVEAQRNEQLQRLVEKVEDNQDQQLASTEISTQRSIVADF